MQWILQLLVQHRNISSLTLTVLLSLWMISSPETRQRQIMRSLTLTVFFPLQFTVEQVTRARNIFAENRRLRQELTQLRAVASLMEEQVAENQRLRELLGMKDSLSFSLIPARVIAREPSHMYRSFIINTGTGSGITQFMPVVNSRGIVGKVILVLPHISLVQALLDPSARTSVMTTRGRCVGILETENGKSVFIRHLKHADVAPGDTVATTGFGGIYPKGLLVGTVTEIKDNSSDPLFKRTIISLSVNYERLEEVFVMKLSPQWTVISKELDSIDWEQ